MTKLPNVEREMGLLNFIVFPLTLKKTSATILDLSLSLSTIGPTKIYDTFIHMDSKGGMRIM